jgi:hypothetical protein
MKRVQAEKEVAAYYFKVPLDSNSINHTKQKPGQLVGTLHVLFLVKQSGQMTIPYKSV